MFLNLLFKCVISFFFQMIMNMSRKRSPRKKRFEFCHRPNLEWWFITSVLVTFIILTDTKTTALAFQNKTEHQENSVQDITKLQHEPKHKMPTMNGFNDSIINYSELPEHKTRDNNVASVIINKLVNAEPNLDRFPAIITTTANVIGDKMAASEQIIKDKNKYSTDNITSDSIVVLKDDVSNLAYAQLNNITRFNDNSTHNAEKLHNTTQIIQKHQNSTAAISVPCPYKMLGSNTQNCDSNLFNTGEKKKNNTAKKHQKRLIDDLNREDYVVNDIDYMKNGVKVDFNYDKDGGINVNVAQKNTEVLNMNAHKDVNSSAGGQESNVNNLVKLFGGHSAKSSVQNSAGRNNSVGESGSTNNDVNNSVRNSGNQKSDSANIFLNNNHFLGRTNVYLYGGPKSIIKNFVARSDRQNNSVNDFVTSTGGQNNSGNDFVTSSGGQNDSVNDFFTSTGERNSSVNDFVASSYRQNDGLNDFVTSYGKQNNSAYVTSSGGQNNSINNLTMSFTDQNKSIKKLVSSFDSQNSTINHFDANSGSQNNESIHNNISGSKNSSANSHLNNNYVRGRTNVYLYGGPKTIKSSGRQNNSVNNFVTSSGGQNSSLNNFISSSESHNISVNEFLTSFPGQNVGDSKFVVSSDIHNNRVNNIVTNSGTYNNSVQGVFMSFGGHNKSAVMKNIRVKTFKGHINETHVKAGEGYILLEDEKDEYEASRDHALDEYDRTTIHTKSVCKLYSK